AVLQPLPAALVGGLDSFAGALVGGLIVAGAEGLLIYYVDPLLSDVVPFLALIAMLIVRPWGVFGTREGLDRVLATATRKRLSSHQLRRGPLPLSDSHPPRAP